MNILILAAKWRIVDNSTHSTSKLSATNLIQKLSKELTPKGIRVNNVVRPVLIETLGLMTALVSRYTPLSKNRSCFSENFIQNQSVLGCLTTTNEIVYCSMFLVSEKIRGITGQSKHTDYEVLQN